MFFNLPQKRVACIMHRVKPCKYWQRFLIDSCQNFPKQPKGICNKGPQKPKGIHNKGPKRTKLELGFPSASNQHNQFRKSLNHTNIQSFPFKNHPRKWWFLLTPKSPENLSLTTLTPNRNPKKLCYLNRKIWKRSPPLPSLKLTVRPWK